MDYVHTLLIAGLTSSTQGGGGAQSSRSETLKHQRERHYPERTERRNKHTPNTQQTRNQTLNIESA